MKHLDLFSGIGGFAYAAQEVWGVEYENVGFCDNNSFAQDRLKEHWPNAIIYDDIKKLEPPPADIVTGGFPCQPFSKAGKRRGDEDDRYLWPEMLRVIKQSRPAWVIGENVTGIISMALPVVLTDLEDAGYTTRAFTIPAAAVGAPHRRDRVWIVAHTDIGRDRRHQRPSVPQSAAPREVFSSDWRKVAAELRGVDDGVPRRVDRFEALGNAIVPQVAAEIMRAIKIVDETQTH